MDKFERPLSPSCGHSGLIYDDRMQRRITLIIMVGLPVLIGQFVFDWIDSDLRSAVGHLPLRAILILLVLLIWAAFREHHERKKRNFR